MKHNYEVSDRPTYGRDTMQLKLKMKCPMCGEENALKVYEYNENHVKQMAEISGQCIKCPMEYNFTIKGPANTEKLRELVYAE